MPQPTRGDVHVNAPLTNISVAYLQDQKEFIADSVFPAVPVAKQSDRYFLYKKGQWFRSDAQIRGVSQETAGTGYEIDNTPNYYCDVWGLHKDIDDQIRANADAPLNLDREATELVTRQLLIKKEKLWAGKYFTTGVWTGSSTGADVTPVTRWNASGATPIKDVRAQIDAIHTKTGIWPNTLVLAKDVWSAVQDSADFLDRIAITRDKIVTPDLLASVLEIERVVIAKAVENTAAEGAADAMVAMYADDALVCYAAPRPGIMTPSAGYTFSWSGLLGAVEGTRIKRFREERLASDRVEGEMAFDQKLVAADLGAFFNDCLA